jgi:hypothetical protein
LFPLVLSCLLHKKCTVEIKHAFPEKGGGRGEISHEVLFSWVSVLEKIKRGMGEVSGFEF